MDDSGWGAAAAAFDVRKTQHGAAQPLAVLCQLSEQKPKGRPKKRSLQQWGVQGLSLGLDPDLDQDASADHEQALVLASDSSCGQSQLCFPLVQRGDLSSFTAIQQLLLGRQRRLRAINTTDIENQDALAKFVERTLQPSKPISSKQLVEDSIGGAAKGYHEAVAASLIEAGHCQWSLLLKHCMEMIQSKQFKGLLFVKQRFFDETPLRIRVDKGAPSICKVLQSHFRIAMVLQNRNTQEIYVYSGFVPTWLQVLPDKKAESIMQAQLTIGNCLQNLDACSMEFDMSVQMVTSDRAGENFKCETGINRLHPHFRKCHLPCDVHKTSTCINNMFKLTEEAITGVVNVGLMFRPGGTLQQFYQCIRDEIKAKLKVIVGPPPDGYIATYRHEVYDLFLGQSFSNQDVKKKQYLLRIRQVQTLNYFLNGDIQNDEIVWYAPFQIDIEDAVAIVCKYVPVALLPSAIAVFPRHRWHGCEIPIDQLGLLSAHHNLLKHACQRFLKLFPDKAAAKSTQTAVDQKPGWADAAAGFMRAAESLQPIADVSNSSELPDALPEAGDSEPKKPSWEEFNRSIRARVNQWILSQQAFVLPLLRFACSPTIGFMFQCLKISSEAWETEQEHAELNTGTRKYRVLEAFLGKALDGTFNDLSERLHAQIPALPLEAHDRRHCVLLFCLIAREAASLHLLIRNMRSGFPYKLFGCLDGRAQEVLDSAPCLHDPLTRAFIETFGTVGLDCLEAKAVLHTLAEVALVDIASVESRHASVRRALEAGSVQTWRSTLCTLSADFACRQSNGWRHHFSKRLFTTPSCQQQKRGGRPSRRRKTTRSNKRCGGGGAYRAFLREKLKDQNQYNNMSVAMRNFGAEYRALTADQRARFQDIGAAATLSHRAGHRAFGPRKRKDKKREPQVGNVIATTVHNTLDKKICMKRRHSTMQAVQENAKRAKVCEDLVAYCRKESGMPVQHTPPATEADAVDNVLEVTSIPVPSTIAKSFRIIAPNAKVTKAGFGNCMLGLGEILSSHGIIEMRVHQKVKICK